MDLRSTMRRVAAYIRDLWGGEQIGRDPIDHPEILRMTHRQLADLPFEPYSRDERRKGGAVPHE